MDSSLDRMVELTSKFFTEDHMETGKSVKSHELITIRPEILGAYGSHHRSPCGDVHLLRTLGARRPWQLLQGALH
jgi:hypothetical protein